MFLYNVNTQKPFQETKIWDRVCLTNIQNSKSSMKYYKVNLRVFRQYQGTRTIFKKKNKGQNGFKKPSKF